MPPRTRLNLRRWLQDASRARLWAIAGGLALAALLLSAERSSILERDDGGRDLATAAATAIAAGAPGDEPGTPLPASARAQAETRAALPAPGGDAIARAREHRRIWVQGVIAALALLLLCGLYDASRRPRGGRSGPSGTPPGDTDAASLPQAGAGSPRQSDMLMLAGSRMRQPLHALSLFAGSLDRDALPAQRQALRGLEASVREIAGVIDEVEQISRLLRHEAPIARAALPVGEAFDRLRPLAVRVARDHGIDVHWRAGRLQVHSDPALACMLLRALVGHAVRHARHRVLVAARPASGRVHVQVRDDGVALELAGVASPLEALLQRAQEGDDRDAGLELAVGAGIVDVLGLEIRARSAREYGNTVTVDFPRAGATAATRPDDATALSLALLESEARQGRRTQSRLPDAPKAARAGDARSGHGHAAPAPEHAAPVPGSAGTRRP
ncbi:HAMP domain-containing histidine kinase [Luteimonas sp. SJ-92]|uniref:histidine kinase n=1 Tax=Luteimonas salinisoli TaxID=2752307 RepID=A0A853JIM2_9GAMM|nr:HAMP domain-containing histidine kinase [Luteimonas salinisoli]NZA28584.1 HAMP domain-containing histidine kinase [Luteimonas salinisoli]